MTEVEKRIDALIKHTGGTMPVGMATHTREEADEAKTILARKRSQGAKLTVYLQVRADGHCIPA